jgi:hypothetical protein
VKASKLVDVKPKKKCCRSKPRCKRCPVVILVLRKADSDGLRGKQLEKVLRHARRK